jgi:hypothetical protein
LVFSKDVSDQVSTQPTRGKRRSQDIGVQKHSHETSRITSSSVR